MLWKITEPFTCMVITNDHPEGTVRSFRRQERLLGEKKEIWSCGTKVNFMSEDYLALGVPLSALVPDGKGLTK